MMNTGTSVFCIRAGKSEAEIPDCGEAINLSSWLVCIGLGFFQLE